MIGMGRGMKMMRSLGRVRQEVHHVEQGQGEWARELESKAKRMSEKIRGSNT
jgi:hypothetical protein